MKTYTEYLWFNTEKVREDINITKQVKEILKKSEIKEGLLIISTMHASAGVYIDDYEPEVKDELNVKSETDQSKTNTTDTEEVTPQKNVVISQQIVIPITYEKLDLGL